MSEIDSSETVTPAVSVFESERPATVTASAILTAIVGFYSVLWGIYICAYSSDSYMQFTAGMSDGSLAGIGALFIAGGIAIIVLTGGVFRGSNPQRLAVVCLLIVGILLTVFGAVLFQTPLARCVFTVGIALNAAAIGLLFGGKAANAYFEDKD